MRKRVVIIYSTSTSCAGWFLWRFQLPEFAGAVLSGCLLLSAPRAGVRGTETALLSSGTQQSLEISMFANTASTSGVCGLSFLSHHGPVMHKHGVDSEILIPKQGFWYRSHAICACFYALFCCTSVETSCVVTSSASSRGCVKKWPTQKLKPSIPTSLPWGIKKNTFIAILEERWKHLGKTMSYSVCPTDTWCVKGFA